MVASRSPVNHLYVKPTSDSERPWAVGIKSVVAIDDCNVPATIAAAVYDRHQVAQNRDSSHGNPGLPFRRDLIALSMWV